MPAEADPTRETDPFQPDAPEETLSPGQLPDGSPLAADAGPDESSRPITRAELRQVLAQSSEETRRLVQSLVDKQGSRFDRRLQELTQGNQRALAVAKKAGLSADQLAAYEKALGDDALQTALSAPAEEPAQPGAGAADPTERRAAGAGDRLTNEQITERGLSLLAELGIEDNDPEMALLITRGSPEEYFTSIRVAGQQKRLRLQNRPASPARLPALGTGGAPAGRNRTRNVQDAGTLFEMAEDDLTHGRPV